MSDETKREIYEYLQRYIHQQQDHSNYIDYYDLYGIKKEMSLDEIKKEFRKKEKYLNPDQISFIDEEFKYVFKKCSDEFIKAKNVFSDEQKKKQYDHNLETEKIKIDNVNINKSYFKDDDAKILESAIETTIYKYGFYQGYTALQNAVRNDFSYIVRDNGARGKAQGLGSNRIKEIIYENRKDVMENKEDNLVMDYFSNLIEKSGLCEKADSFYDMCTSTIQKYDLTRNSNQTATAIKIYLGQGETQYFTNNNRLREVFEENNFSSSDIDLLMCVKLHKYGHDDPRCLFSNTAKMNKVERVDLFTSKLKEEAVKYNNTSKTS